MNSVRILESEVNMLPTRRKVKSPNRSAHALATLVVMAVFVAALVYIGRKIDWVQLVWGARAEQITFTDGEQKRPLIAKSEDAPERMVW